MGPFEADGHRRSPPLHHGSEGETIPQIASNENLRQNHPERSDDESAHNGTVQLLMMCELRAGWRAVLLDSEGENEYARDICRQAVEKSPLLLCDGLGLEPLQITLQV
jgi:hypothetical protein